MKPWSILAAIISLSLTACGQSNADPENQQAVDALIKKTKENLVYVKGGSFQMGDFGQVDSKAGKLPYTYGEDNKHLHEVTLDGYYMASRQVSYSDFYVYTKSMGQPDVSIEGFGARFQSPNVPVGVSWNQAHDYCQWMAEKTGRPYALPTEAQWEYAARNRGEFWPYATDDGTLERGKNAPSKAEIRKTTVDGAAPKAFEIASIPANPLGIYQMGLNGFEWVNDWYGKDYYEHSPEKNPMGPEEGTEKVLRGGGFSASDQGMLTVYRSKAKPDLTRDASDAIDNPRLGEMLSTRAPFETTFRCVVNEPVR
ncbi:SUMF1/EgtB/PvdO family nonheme iron enzyme [Salinicola sp. DM10]|uniref:formylglycine-generating enzyme family protein n=1 Tax=Salinicola sp. DM10 TaxID=2815721 RepID=UPI001A8E1232|nr:SUMF1/EgtB/PvdO family nonheme iron enzyme [Salinicola sp. DM10]MCE3027087.1 formylglycine-generating enzyme family protein [Salinicola sp. DM10]